ncbi:MAG: hypothetical protein OEY64_07230 [Nitrospinota bacterium]|nr:hypothetical protein [Nitrospinota bacterium]
MLDNLSVQKYITSFIEKTFSSNGRNTATIQVGEIEINDFSICFWVEIEPESGKYGLYVKLPKEEVEKTEMWRINESDREMGEKEYESLQFLDKNWIEDEDSVKFIKPVAYLQKYNAIVTERIYAKGILPEFRALDTLKRIIPFVSTEKFKYYLANVGRSLRKYHDRVGEPVEYDLANTVTKIKTRLKSLDIPSTTGNDTNEWHVLLAKISGLTEKTVMTKTLKGLDIRNVFIGDSGKIYLLDPGRLKNDCREADLARFLVTIRILYWGTLRFFLRLKPLEEFEKFFLKGYYGSDSHGGILLRVFIIKELVKHWDMAYFALSLKSWPKPIKYILKNIYINGYYESEISAHFRRLKDEIS